MRLNTLLILCLFASSYSYAAEPTPTETIVNGDTIAKESLEQEYARLQLSLNRLNNDVKAIEDAETDVARASTVGASVKLQGKADAAWKQLFRTEREISAAEFPLLRSQPGFSEALEKYIKAKDQLANVNLNLISDRSDLEILRARPSSQQRDEKIDRLMEREEAFNKLESETFDFSIRARKELDTIARNGMDSVKFASRLAGLKKAGKIGGVGATLVGAGALGAYMIYGPDSKVSTQMGSPDSSMANSLRSLASDPKVTDSTTHGAVTGQ